MNIFNYTGYLEKIFTEEEMAKFYEGKIFPKDLNLLENQYLYVEDSHGKIVDKYRVENNKFIPLKYIPTKNTYIDSISPRNEEQKLAFDMLQNPNITVNLLTGRFGSGKTLVMLANAFSEIEKGRARKIVWVRNNIEVKNTKALGALPGLF